MKAYFMVSLMDNGEKVESSGIPFAYLKHAELSVDEAIYRMIKDVIYSDYTHEMFENYDVLDWSDSIQRRVEIERYNPETRSGSFAYINTEDDSVDVKLNFYVVEFDTDTLIESAKVWEGTVDKWEG